MSITKRQKLVALLVLMFGGVAVIDISGTMLGFTIHAVNFVSSGYLVLMLAIIFRVRDGKRQFSPDELQRLKIENKLESKRILRTIFYTIAFVLLIVMVVAVYTYLE